MKKERKEKTKHLVSLQMKLRSTFSCLFGGFFEAPLKLQKAKDPLQKDFCPLLPSILA